MSNQEFGPYHKALLGFMFVIVLMINAHEFRSALKTGVARPISRRSRHNRNISRNSSPFFFWVRVMTMAVLAVVFMLMGLALIILSFTMP